jgi:nitrate reductase delta subunit
MKNLKEDFNMKNLGHYTSLAEMFRYPSDEIKEHIPEWKKIILSYDPALESRLEPFIRHLQDQPLSSQQEYYTATFDVHAVCYLDTGYILFGEDVKRGVFLMNIKEEQEKVKNPCGTELPDHLTNMLTLISKISDPELAEELVFSLMVPAVHEMITRFGESDNVYREILGILVTIMENDFPDSAYERFVIPRKAVSGKTEKIFA